MKSQPSSARFTDQSLKKQVFKYTPLVAAIGTVLMMSGCSSDSSSAAAAPTTPAQAFYEILMGGGSNTAATVTTGTGGDGGDLDMYKYSTLAELGIFASGTADASFTPISVSANLGSNPLTVSSDTTVDVLAVEPAAGTAYFVEGDTSGDLYVSDGDGTLGNADADELPVSGISIAAATTLTLTPNDDATPALATGVNLDLDNDLDNNGTLTTANGNLGVRGDLDIDLSSYMASGDINTTGATDGQSGGDVDITARGSIFNDGAINTAGADSTLANGGNGGYFDTYANFHVQNTGAIDTHGGSTTAAGFNGGDGGYVDLYADEGTLWSSGDMNTMGGNGDAGGDGGYVDLYTYYYGELRNSGLVTASGGVGSVASGGDGGDLDWETNGTGFFNNADLISVGGDGVVAGGDGGSIDLYGSYGSSIGADYHRAGEMNISGNIDTRGGNASDPAGDAGDGGYLDLYHEAYYYSDIKGNGLRLLGYTQVDTSGGDGADGGDGGYVNLYSDEGFNQVGYEYLCSNVTNEAPLNLTGGDSLLATGSGAGGYGGYFDLETCYDYGQDSIDPTTGELTAKAMNSGTVDTSGGASYNATSSNSAQGGSVWLWGYNGVTNTADITANGGNDSAADDGTDGFGGNSGYIGIYAEDLPVENTAALTSNGGDGEYAGGYNSSGVELFAPSVNNSGDMTSNGGNADAALAGSTGGDSADIELFGIGVDSVDNTGTITNTPGTGTTPGDEGKVIIGGLCVSGDCS